ncbi:MAG: aminopeptidase P family protein [Acidobacteria bacterium]|nr:aminopeptidase P family protein [Acidobacteriota bacterium]
MRIRSLPLAVMLTAIGTSLALGGLVAAADTGIFQARRQRLAAAIPEGIAIMQSAARNQANLYEFFVPNSDNHDFIYLTGLQTPGATLVLCPGSEEYPEILYVDAEPGAVRSATGIAHVYPVKNLMRDLSNAYTDYSQLRYTQRRFKPLPSEISRVLYNDGGPKVIYFNYPRFVNLDEPPPERLDLARRIAVFSPKYELRDLADILDPIRMAHDEYAVTQLRQAARISGRAMMECMRSTRPGLTEDQVAALFDFACRYQGATRFGFPTEVHAGPRSLDEREDRPVRVLRAGDLVTIDAGAEINHYTADIQRTFPVSGTFTPEQRRVYDILKEAQDACIRLVRPGVTMQDLQNEALRVLDEAGGYGKYFFWGTSHFLGMEVHDHGNNLAPLVPGVCITVEPGIMLPEFTVILEDDVLCTATGYEWLTEFIPREPDEIEQLMQKMGIVDAIDLE